MTTDRMTTGRPHRRCRLAALGAATGLVVSLAAGAVVAPATAAPVTVHGAGGASTVTYLALGDSLSVGFQPGQGRTKQGYVDVLRRSMQNQIPGLGLRNVGCPGETSYSMISGKQSLCHYKAGSQLNAADAFLRSHPGRVAFITVDVGANDLVNRCFDPDAGLIDRDCGAELMPRLQARLTSILDVLRAAAGPVLPIVAMTYYNPFLGFWGLVPGGRAMARANQRVWSDFNAGLTTVYGDAGVTVADVAATFRIDDFTNTVVLPHRGQVPVNVARTCRWTWFCSARFAGDPHARRVGYAKIARTFERELQPLLP